MKKTYVKPQIMFEDFTLNTNIALNCGETNVTPIEDKYGCGYKMRGENGISILFTGLMGCQIKEEDDGSCDGSYNGICYHVPMEGNNLFAS